jgi:tRNA(Ile2) C34 agmatinyltransferase TiaS
VIGDNPYVVAVVVIALAAFLWMKLGRRRDSRRCPQCQRFALSLAGDDAFECQRCGTPLHRDPDGTVRRR